jgi:hypothetical protein
MLASGQRALNGICRRSAPASAAAAAAGPQHEKSLSAVIRVKSHPKGLRISHRAAVSDDRLRPRRRGITPGELTNRHPAAPPLRPTPAELDNRIKVNNSIHA